MFVAVQHPGETDGATFESPASTWPHTDDFPRPLVVAYETLTRHPSSGGGDVLGPPLRLVTRPRGRAAGGTAS